MKRGAAAPWNHDGDTTTSDTMTSETLPCDQATDELTDERVAGGAMAGRGSSQRTPPTVASGETFGPAQRAVAVVYGLVCHLSFALAITAMMADLYYGMRLSLGRLQGDAALLANAVLLAQFPVIHSMLLSRKGSRVLERLAPLSLGTPLVTTTYATIASLQLLLTFALWSPSSSVWWQPDGVARVVLTLLFGCSWLLLLRAMSDAGLAVQTGFLGWSAVASGRRPERIPFSCTGTYRYVRQPVYLAFALILWTAPVWTPDHLYIAAGWTAYCLLGPLLKERRYLRYFGQAYRDYQQQVPYWIPRRLAPADPRMSSSTTGSAP